MGCESTGVAGAAQPDPIWSGGDVVPPITGSAIGGGPTARSCLLEAGPQLRGVLGGLSTRVGGEGQASGPAGAGAERPAAPPGTVTDAERAAVLLAAYSSNDVVLAVDAEGLGAHVARLKAEDEARGAAVQAEVGRLLPASTRDRFEAAVEAHAPGLLGRAWGAVEDAGGWVASRPQALRDWQEGYRPESLGGHVLDAVGTLGVGVLDVAEFAGSVARTAGDLSSRGVTNDLIERLTGREMPSWMPSAERGVQSLGSAAETVEALARDPGLIWDGLTDSYVKLWAEGRYGGLVGQAVADFGDVLLGSKGAGRAGGALADLARAGRLSSLDAVADVLTAARRADAVAPGEFMRVADELVAAKRADGTLGDVVDAARRTDTLPDLIGRGLLTRGDLDGLVRSGALTLDEAAKARLPFGGARYADELPDSRTVETYARIEASAESVAAVARSTGVDPHVVAEVREHLFVREHDITFGPNDVRRGNFTPLKEIADDWTAAAAGPLSGEQLARLRRTLAHEYVESRLMEAGLPFRSAHPDAFDPVRGPLATPQHFGAHDLAPLGNEMRPPFAHYETLLQRPVPVSVIADDLSNLDTVVAEILESLP